MTKTNAFIPVTNYTIIDKKRKIIKKVMDPAAKYNIIDVYRGKEKKSNLIGYVLTLVHPGSNEVDYIPYIINNSKKFETIKDFNLAVEFINNIAIV